MSTVTISGTPISLWFLVRESTSIFDITVGSDNRVSELKTIIKERKQNDFANIDADRLKLLKLKNPVDDGHISDIRNFTLQVDEEEDDNVTLMKDMRKIATYWPENQAPPEDLIHVIVEAPDLAEQPSATGLVFVFIDNTNVCEQGKKLVMSSENISKEYICIDYGRLVNFVLNGRKLGDDPVIAGSPPHMNDTLYKYLKENGFKARKFSRNSAGQEKEVDGEVCASIADVMERYKRPGTIILLGGDGDYGPRIRRALLKGWTVEIWFWKIGMATRIKDIELPDFPELKTIYINMDPYYKNFMNAYGVVEGKKYLEIIGDTVNYESVMACCVETGLFCAWCKFSNGSLKMYCNTFDDWGVIKNYMMNKYPQAQEIVRTGDVSY